MPEVLSSRISLKIVLRLNQRYMKATPCLVINHIVKDLEVSYIAVDNVKGGFTAAEYLVNLGHKRIATITGNMQTQAGIDRFEGFQNALAAHGVDCPPDYVYKGDYSRRSARLASERFFSLDNPPTAIFAASDDMALEIISVAMENGIKVPEDISIIGFDDNPAGLVWPRWIDDDQTAVVYHGGRGDKSDL